MSIATATATVSAAASSSLSAATADAAGHMKMKSLSFALPCCWTASFSHQNFNTAALAHFPSRRTCTRVICEVAISSSPSSSSNEVSPSTSSEDAAADAASSKIGARVRVKVPLKVHHVPRVPEVDITGLEGELKQYVGLWKGKRISANLPYKVQFIVDVQGRGAVKFFAHLKEDEFDYI